MSLTPKKIEFMMIKDSAAELVIAKSVAFIDSEESWRGKEDRVRRFDLVVTYDSFLLNDVDGGVDVVLRGQRDAQESVHDSYSYRAAGCRASDCLLNRSHLPIM